jgi:hypothetical protein
MALAMAVSLHATTFLLAPSRTPPDGDKKGPAIAAGPSYAYAVLGLARGDVVRTRALLALSDLKIDRLTLIEGGVARGFDLRVVDEQVVSAIRRSDETKSLACVEPFHCAFCHECFSFRPIRPANVLSLGF